MSNVTFQLDRAGVGELLRSPEMDTVVMEFANQVVGRAGEGYEASSHDSGQRRIANVYPASKEAAKENYEQNTLLKALGG